MLGLYAGAHEQAVAPYHWPRFRGPDSNPVSDNSNLPVTWSKTENVEWVADVPGVGRQLVELKDARAAEALIAEHRQALIGSDKKLLYIVRYPSAPTKRPTNEQIAEYTLWFQDVETRWETGAPTEARGRS